MPDCRWISLLPLLLLCQAVAGHAAPPSSAQPFERRQSAHFILAVPRGHDAGQILSELEAAYTYVRNYGITLPSKLNARVYGSTAEFVQGGGGSAYHLALFNGGVIHLQPMRLLARRGDLGRVLRHELVHAGLERAARQGLPRWLNEGFAMVVAGERVPETIPFRRLEDLEDSLARAGSYTTLRSAYGTATRLAAALVAQIGKGNVLALIRAVAAGETFTIRFQRLTGSPVAEWSGRLLTASRAKGSR